MPMHQWRTTYDREKGRRRHKVAPHFGHALLAPLVGYVFKVLRVSGAVWEHGNEWWPIHSEPSIHAFEVEHGAALLRHRYNLRSFADVRRQKRTVRAEHAGFCDFFVPIQTAGKVVGVLVAGPFAMQRPTSINVLLHWRSLTGRQGHSSDLPFASYLAAWLSTLVLDDGKDALFAELLECLAQLMAGEGHADALTNRAEGLHQELERIRLPERMWEAVRSMVDERSPATWQSPVYAHELGTFGLSGLPDHVLVGLGTSRAPPTDQVDEAVRGDAFQRACVQLAKSQGNVIAGQVGDRGVVFISAAKGSSARKRQGLLALAGRVSKIARDRFGLEIHFGASVAPSSVSLSRSYEAALGAAESAVAEQRTIVVRDVSTRDSSVSLRDLRKDLGVELEERPDLAAARFERYLDATAHQCGYRRLDIARGHCDAGFERLAEPLVKSRVIDPRTLESLYGDVDRAAIGARSMGELLAVYRRAATDLFAALSKPALVRQDRSLRTALDYIREHYSEPLRVAKIARVAGFAPSHFSRLFIKREGTSFEHYVRTLRIERACQLLAGSDLRVARIAELCGFNSPQYFGRAFRALVGKTPLAYRKTPRKARMRLE